MVNEEPAVKLTHDNAKT